MTPTRVKTKIKQAFEALLSQGADVGVSVEQLTELADVSRKSFYNNYEDIHELYMEVAFERIVQPDLNNINEAEVIEGLANRFDEYCRNGQKDCLAWSWLEWNVFVYAVKSALSLSEGSAQNMKLMNAYRDNKIFCGSENHDLPLSVVAEFSRGIETGLSYAHALDFLSEDDTEIDIEALIAGREKDNDQYRTLFNDFLQRGGYES